jgi:hypothetical protein
VHRDLKPANILLCQANNGAELVKIIDFGLAKLLPEAVTNAKFQQLTDMGLAIGSVQYMSPEQCLGHPASPRSDIYALGCILYECLTGMRLFSADAAVAVMFKHLNESIPLLQPVKNNAASEQLQEILNKALCKDADSRYASMLDFEHDLSEVLACKEPYEHNENAPQVEAPNAVPTTLGKARRAPLLMLVMGACLLIGLAAYLLFSSPPHEVNSTLQQGQQALLSGDYQTARTEFRLALDDLRLSAGTRKRAEVDICLTYAAEGKTDEFFRACDKLRSESRNMANELAVAEQQRYQSTNRLLAYSAAAIVLECSKLKPHELIKSVRDYLAVMGQNGPPVLFAISDEIAIDKMAKALEEIDDYPADFANLYATRARLQARGGGYTACSSTTAEILAKLKSVNLWGEDAEIFRFLSDMYTFNPRQTSYAQSLTAVVGKNWIYSIAWLCEYEFLCGHSQQAKATARTMREWCEKNCPEALPSFADLAGGRSELTMRTDRSGPVRLEILAELPAEPLFRNCLLISALHSAEVLAHEGKESEALALFNAVVAACKRTQTDLPWAGADTPVVIPAKEPKLAEQAFAACDTYYHLMPSLGRDAPEERVHAAAMRDDLACYCNDRNSTPGNLERALRCSQDDLRAAEAEGNPEWIANAQFRLARPYATQGDGEKMNMYWRPAYEYFSQHIKERVVLYLNELSVRTALRNPGLSCLLKDDRDCTVDGVITYPTASDFDLLPSREQYKNQLLGRLRPGLDHALRMGQYNLFRDLSKAAYEAADRCSDEDILRPVLDVACVTLQSGQEKMGNEVLELAQQFANKHKVSALFDYGLKLQQADFLYFYNHPKNEDSALFAKMEALYKADLQAAALVQSEAIPYMDASYADSQFRLARMYITAGDTKKFQPLWDDCIQFYAKRSDNQTFRERVDGMTHAIKDYSHMPELAAHIKSEALALRERLKP